MPIELHPWSPSHGPAIAGIAARIVPFFITSADVVRWHMESRPASARSHGLVAVDGDRVIGYAKSELDWESASTNDGEITLAVDPHQVGRGVGTRLLRAAEQRLLQVGACRAQLWLSTDVVGWGQQRGYRHVRTALQQWLDLDRLPSLPDPPHDLQLLPFSHVGATSPTVWELDVLASTDEPGVATARFSYAEWKQHWEAHPALDPELSLVMVSDGVPVGQTTAFVDGTRYRSGLTGVRQEFRGRGYAKYTKLASLHAARTRGFHDATTGNDAANGPMLAVNQWLGYRRWKSEAQLWRDLKPAP